MDAAPPPPSRKVPPPPLSLHPPATPSIPSSSSSPPKSAQGQAWGGAEALQQQPIAQAGHLESTLDNGASMATSTTHYSHVLTESALQPEHGETLNAPDLPPRKPPQQHQQQQQRQQQQPSSLYSNSDSHSAHSMDSFQGQAPTIVHAAPTNATTSTPSAQRAATAHYPQQHAHPQPQPHQQQRPAEPSQGPPPSITTSTNKKGNNLQDGPLTPRRISSLTFLPSNPSHFFGTPSSQAPASPAYSTYSQTSHANTDEPSNASSFTTTNINPTTASSSSSSMAHTLHTSTTNLASSAAARFSQAFSPLLTSRRKSTVTEPPNTPDSTSTIGSKYDSQSSLATVHQHQQMHQQQQQQLQLQAQQAQHSTSSLGRSPSFSSPRSQARSRKTIQSMGLGQHNTVPEDGQDTPSSAFATTPMQASAAFHTALAPRFPFQSSNLSHHTDQYQDSLASAHTSGSKENGTTKSTSGFLSIGSISSGLGSVGASAGSSANADKALKKAKVFLDDRAKPKARAVSLWSFLDVSFELDQAKFFQEHADQVFTVIHDSFWHQIEKLNKKPDRVNALVSKEVVAIQKTLLLLRLVFLYIPDKIKAGWNRTRILLMLNQVLAHKNNHRLRIFGFRLLLLWLNDMSDENEEVMDLFKNAISMDLFLLDGDDFGVESASGGPGSKLSGDSSGRKSARQVEKILLQAQFQLDQRLLVSRGDGPPICASTTAPKFEESIQLFQIFLANIVRLAYVAAGSTPPPEELEALNAHFPLVADGSAGDIGDGIAHGFGIDAGFLAARFMFDIVKKHYLVKVFPECARSLGLLKDKSPNYGFKTCPPTILRLTISFVIQYCLDRNDHNSTSTHTSPATPILKSIIFSSQINREVMHEIVRQGLSLPAGHPQYKDIIRGAAHIVGVWCLSSEEERPSFLRSSSSRTHPPSSGSTPLEGAHHHPSGAGGLPQGVPSDPYYMANVYLQRYLKLLTEVIYDRPTNELSGGYSNSSTGTTANPSSEALGSTFATKLDASALCAQYRDIVGLFRAIMTQCQIEMDTVTWDVMLGSLLEIQRRFMNQTEKYSTPIPQQPSDDLANFILDTVLCAFARCPHASRDQWLNLRRTMANSHRWPQAITQWSRWTMRLTTLAASDVYGVDLEAQHQRLFAQQTTGGRHNRKMSDKLRHPRHSAAAAAARENPLRHSIGSELLSAYGIATHAHQTYPGPPSGLSGLAYQDRTSRRALSVQHEHSKQQQQQFGQSGFGKQHQYQSTQSPGLPLSLASTLSGYLPTAAGTSVYTPAFMGHMGFLPSRELGRDQFYGKDEPRDFEDEFGASGGNGSGLQQQRTGIFSDTGEELFMAATNTGTDERLSRASSVSFHGPDSFHLDPVADRLSSSYGVFPCPEFFGVTFQGRPIPLILSLWKNMVCAMGNPNAIPNPAQRVEVMTCVIDVWDMLNLTSQSQVLHAIAIPALYEFAPWFFEAVNNANPQTAGIGLPAVYGCICRMMCRRHDQMIDADHFPRFYHCIIKGLWKNDPSIGYAILTNCSRIFTLCLPGSHILIPAFLKAIRQMLLLENGCLHEGVNHFIRKHAIALLSSMTMLFSHYEGAPLRYPVQESMTVFGSNSARSQPGSALEWEQADFGKLKATFAKLIIDLTRAETTVNVMGKFWDTHSMLIQLCGMLVINEWQGLSSAGAGVSLDTAAVHDPLDLVLDHLYWIEPNIVQNALEVLTTLAGIYNESDDHGHNILEKIMTHLLSALQAHFKSVNPDARRGSTIASFFQCVIEWIMVIPVHIFTSTHLSRWVLELIESGLPDGGAGEDRKRLFAARERQQARASVYDVSGNRSQQQSAPGKKQQSRPNFKFSGRALHQYRRVMYNTASITDNEFESQIIKEAAEATLIHLLHYLNNFPPPHGVGMMQSSILGPGTDVDYLLNPQSSFSTMNTTTSAMAYENGPGRPSMESTTGTNNQPQFTMFALNNSTLITLVEVAATRTEPAKSLMIIRDETGRYSYDSELLFRATLEPEPPTPRSSMDNRRRSRHSQYFHLANYYQQRQSRKEKMADQLVWRDSVKIRKEESIATTSTTATQEGESGILSTTTTLTTATTTTSTSTSTFSPKLGSPMGGGYSRTPGELPIWKPGVGYGGTDMLNQLLQFVGDEHPDCLFDGRTPLNVLNNGLTISAEARMSSIIDAQMLRHVQEENYYTRISDPQARAWYDKLVQLRTSLVNSDMDDDELYSGSNNLMSLISMTWDTDTGLENVEEEDLGATGRASFLEGEKVINGGGEGAINTTLGHQQFLSSSSTASHRASLDDGLIRDDYCIAKSFQVALPPEPEPPMEKHQQNRLFLSHFGLLGLEGFQENNFVLLNPTPALAREIRGLDKKSGQETCKIAVLYVGPGQETEQLILQNQVGSAAYQDFVLQLGWEIDIATHPGYVGGLERNGTNGKTAVYYCSSTVEMVFHDVTRMPTDPDDPRQLKKKRHIGNDHVHIIWSEHSRPYDRNTIGGDFGNVLIVISPIMDTDLEIIKDTRSGRTELEEKEYLASRRASAANAAVNASTGPLGSGVVMDRLLSVEVVRDMNLPVFGPLVDGMVVPLSKIGALVRQTALHGARLASAPPPLPPTPSPLSFSTGGYSSLNNNGGATPSTTASTTSAVAAAIGGAAASVALMASSVSGGGGGSTSSLQGSSSTTSKMGFHALSGPGGSSVVPGGNSSGSHHSHHNDKDHIAHSNGFYQQAGSGSSGAIFAAGGGQDDSGSSTTNASTPSVVVMGGVDGNLQSGGADTQTGSVSSSSTTSLLLLNTISQQPPPPPTFNLSVAGSPSPPPTTAPSPPPPPPPPPPPLPANSYYSSTLPASMGSGGFGTHHVHRMTLVGQPSAAMYLANNPSGASGSLSSSMASSSPQLHQPHPFRQRAQGIEQIAKRYKLETWTFEKFIQHIFSVSTGQQTA